MYLKNLILTNFKNYELTELEFSPKINCFVGNNGVGKTNILDAIHYLSLAKSFFNNIDSLSIRHGEDYFILQGTMARNDGEDQIYCAFQKQKQKLLKRNGKEYQKLSEHVGRYPVVMISPADSVLISEGSEDRRRFMNKIISQYNAEYLDSVLKYNKALQQRNQLLKDFRSSGKFDSDMISGWDSRLIKYGSYIFKERDLLVKELIPVFQEYYSLISSGKETVKLQYRSHLSEGDFGLTLANAINKDRILEYTTVGIHKDDLLLDMNDFPVKSLGSQGQQKSYLVSLKLAKFDYIKHKAGFSPILLLDDIFDKFDAERVEQIIRLVGNHRFGQIFITDTHQSRLHEILTSHNTDYKLFNISENRVEVITRNGKNS
ncbi:MAG: DNA recombination protein RecF [Bacteroidetes bacterium GWE2_41_25]|nr:MAG: DNA recombination protein RecF [Bacteroidetes bacterium GWA2_40_15]OFX92180.1 MAG: DNA recombination protein RecF [Bacteroidetes bacterium GWC2_40_22]OFY01989.1 MAG: DNA recombination protein RecF [Bacteroidetes bacterium GWE2_41_25]HAM08765.1 DNA replication and repair protein RecF [Bacteroidales bacterium]HCU20023.1 DNA replication and repair protein RecF [Bacteroidales bacterium]